MTNASDIRKDGWIDRFVPLWLRPYARLARIDRPIGTWLLLFPAWWALALASRGFPDVFLTVAMAFGAFLIRAAGCTINDIMDRDFDRQVARTADRPLASGSISLFMANLFVFLLMAVGALLLVMIGSWPVFWAAVASLPLIAIYPLMKRMTFWPQAFLGLTFNWGIWVAWVAVQGKLGLVPLLLYIGNIFWTLHYDTIYAHQDKLDDQRIGIKSTALLFGARTKRALVVFVLLAAFFWTLALSVSHVAWPSFLFLLLALAEMLRQIVQVNLNDPKDCLHKFKDNQRVGWLFLIGLLLA